MQNSQPEHRVLDDARKTSLDAMWVVRDVADRFHAILEAHPPSHELGLAKAKIEEAVMWAVRGIPANVQQQAAQEVTDVRRLLMDLYDRIIAAVASVKAGDTTALQAHVAAIDAHLTQIDGSDADEKTRLATIEAGLNKIADTVNPVTPAPSGDGTTTSPTPAADPTA